MKKIFKALIATMCAAVMSLPMLASACTTNGKPKLVDYVSQVKLDLSSETKKQEVTVRLYVDGDTTHFNPVANSSIQGCNNAADFSTETAPTKGYAKARYLAINTPESTGQIEEWGKKASNFTRSKLESAQTIIIESDDSQWNIDSTGERYLLWVWYKPQGETEFKNLNIEILQNGLAFDSAAGDNRYGTYAKAAVTQATEAKLVVFSDDKDPDYYYGGPIHVTLKELRFNSANYKDKKIVVEGTVVANFNNSVYIEETYYDIEGYEKEGLKIGMPVYYAYTKGKVLDILSVGNKVSVVGVLQYYETGGYYQITDIKTYDRYKPDNPDNCNIIKEGVGIEDAFGEISLADFTSTVKSVSVDYEAQDDEGKDIIKHVTLSYKEAILSTSVSLNNLTVYKVSRTKNEDSSNYGAMTLYCRDTNGNEVSIRTVPFYKSDADQYTELDDKLVPNSYYEGKTIASVKGIVEYYQITDSQTGEIVSTTYQIKVHRMDYIVLG